MNRPAAALVLAAPLAVAVAVDWVLAAPAGDAPAAAPAAVAAPAAPVPGDWPTAAWRTQSPEAAGFDRARLDAMLAYLFPATTAEVERERRGVRTDAFVLIKGGALVCERYARGYHEGARHYGWSMGKSVTNVLIGIAEREGLLRRDQPIVEVDPSLAGKPQLAGLTVDHLLHMSSGLAWSETYEYSPLKSTVISMLYTAGFGDMAAYVAGRPREVPPGQRFRYSSGDTNLLAALLKARLPAASHDEYPYTKLFGPLGMTSAVFEQDGSGTFVGSSYVHATARDFARFGLLLLRRGVWEGRALVPDDWLDYSTRLAPAYATTPADEKYLCDKPGAMFWLNHRDARCGQPWPAAPEDTFAPMGHWGQSIFVLPGRDLVAVRLADDRDGSFDANRYLGLLLASLPPGAP